MPERIVDELRGEFDAATPEAWPRVLHSVAARAVAAELLAALDRPPSPHSRLGWELRLRVSKFIPLREVA
jgi:hypothetical protein